MNETGNEYLVSLSRQEKYIASRYLYDATGSSLFEKITQLKFNMQEYTKTDRQLHWLCQLIAKANRAWVPEKEDDRHTNLYYDPLSQRILGRWIESPAGRVILVLDLRHFRFQWLASRLDPVFSVPCLNLPVTEMESKIAAFPASLGMYTAKFHKKLHFEIPDYTLQQLTEDDFPAEGLEKWKYYRKLANGSCLALKGFLQSVAEIRIWPHHFDTGIYLQFSRDLGLGFGLAMEDEMVSKPYFYMVAYKLDSTIYYEDLPVLEKGRWIIDEGWNGAVLELSDIPFGFHEEAGAVADNFIRETSEWLIRQ